MNAKDVRPGKWMEDDNYPPQVLYDDGDYSVIWGKYEGELALGARWNNNYPRQADNPTWYVEPPFLTITILDKLLTIATEKNHDEYVENIRFAMKEFVGSLD